MPASPLSPLQRPRPTTRIATALAAAVLVLGSTGPASAATLAPASDGRSAYERALAHFQAAEFRDAALAFEEAYEDLGDPTLLYNIALSWEEAGEFEKALDALILYEAEASEDEREELERFHKSLETRIEAAEAPVEGDQDDEDDEPGPGDTFAGTDTASGSDPQDDPAAEDEPRVFTPLAGVLLGIGVVGIGAGIGLGVTSQQNSNDAEAMCASGTGGLVCPTPTSDKQDTARALALGADVSFALGGAAIVGAIVVLAINGRRRAKSRDVAVAPLLSPERAGLTLTGRF